LIFGYGGKAFVVEVKSGNPVSAQQVRLGAGQVLEYRDLLRDGQFGLPDVRAVLLLDGEPPLPWREMARSLGIWLLNADRLEDSLTDLLSGTP
jgi:hypothetical protein